MERISRRLGQRVGPCLLKQLLGSGAQGAVYEAYHQELDRKVAIKLVDGENTDERTLARFQRESTTEIPPSPFVAHPLGHGEHEGVLYLIQEFVEGETLLTRVERDGPLEVEASIVLASGLAQGLADIHGAGLIHRDLKPENVMLTPEGTPKLVDFGIAREVDQTEGLTIQGTPLGSPRYMAPEQVSAGKIVDARTDVHGLGVVLHYALTGRVPHEAVDDDSRALMYKRAVFPAEDVRVFRPEVHPQLALLLARLLASEPELRPTAAESRRQLERVLELVRGDDERPAGSETWSVAVQVKRLERSRARLLACAPGTEVGIHALNEVDTVLGRDHGCDVILTHRTVSHEHARITWRDGRPHLEDLGAKNGTFVEGHRLEPHQPVPLEVEACLILGELPCLFLAKNDEQTAADNERLGLLIRKRKLTVELAEAARREADQRGITAGEVLLCARKLTLDEWINVGARGCAPLALLLLVLLLAVGLG